MTNKKFKQNFKQKGGFITGKEQEFLEFIDNSKLQLLSSGSYGCTYIVELDVCKTSNIKHMDIKGTNPINKLLIKLCIISDQEYKITDFINDGLYSVNLDSFISEVNVQIEIFTKSFKYLQPICPAIISAYVYEFNDQNNNNSQVNKLFEILSEKMAKMTIPIDLNTIKAKFQNKPYSNMRLGIIGMEFADGYNLLYTNAIDLINKYRVTKEVKLLDQYKYIILSSIYLIIELIYMGYNHGDFHLSNILFNSKDESFIKGKIGRPLLIDFGLVRKLSKENIEIINYYKNNNNYSGILNYIYTHVPRGDNSKLNSWPRLYGVLTGYFDRLTRKKVDTQFGYYPFINKSSNKITFNEDFTELIKLREEQIDLNIEEFNKNRKKGGFYLPLDTSIINKMFRGIFTIINANNTKTNILSSVKYNNNNIKSPEKILQSNNKNNLTTKNINLFSELPFQNNNKNRKNNNNQQNNKQQNKNKNKQKTKTKNDLINNSTLKNTII
jgi:hypothetical protein